MMTFRDIRESRGRLYQNGSQFARLLTDYYGRIAFPLVTIIMVLVGIALESSPKRHPGRQHGDRDRTGLARRLLLLGRSLNCHRIRTWGALPPVVAGWLTNVLFTSYGLYLMLKLKY